LQIASNIVPRYFRSIAPIREITIMEEVLLRWCSVGISQQGSSVRYREGYMDSILVLMAGSLALVGILWTRNLD
jgi:hypothetical protein